MSVLLGTHSSAIAKRALSEYTTKQSDEAFKTTEKTEIARAQLNDLEDFTMTIFAFDSHQLRAVKLWGDAAGHHNWTLPASMMRRAKEFFPRLKEEKKEEKKAEEKKEEKPAEKPAEEKQPA